jgi:hypothetical protein
MAKHNEQQAGTAVVLVRTEGATETPELAAALASMAGATAPRRRSKLAATAWAVDLGGKRLLAGRAKRRAKGGDDGLAAAKAELAALLKRVAELQELVAEKQNHYLWTSKPASPCRLVREIFLAKAWEAQRLPVRGTVLKACTNAGIAENTAKTQYQLNRKRWLAGELTLEDAVAEA